MFRRSETARERTLLKLIEQQQRTIADLTDRLMHATGNTWNLPPHPEPTPATRPQTVESWSASPEQEPKF